MMRIDSFETPELIARRLKAAHELADLTQAQMAEKLGFKDRQTLAAIEAGQRKISAEELLRAMECLGVDLDYLTNPFRLVGEGQFSCVPTGTPRLRCWRHSRIAPDAGSPPIGGWQARKVNPAP